MVFAPPILPGFATLQAAGPVGLAKMNGEIIG
jgi:hypothetical protein